MADGSSSYNLFFDQANLYLIQAKTHFYPLLEGVKNSANLTTVYLSDYVSPYHDDIRKIHRSAYALPETYLLIGHCAFMSILFSRPPFRQYWLISFWLSFLGGFGGGTIANILLGVPPVWLKLNELLIIFSITWWFVAYFPFTRPILTSYPFKILYRLASNILRARIIYSRCDDVVTLFGVHNFVAPMFLGTIAGCGGKLICDVAGSAFHLDSPAELAKPSWSLRSAFGMSLIYMTLVHWLELFPSDVAQGIIITLLVGQGIASDLSGYQMDFTYPFSYLFHLITFIPEPPESSDASVQTESRNTKKKKLVPSEKFPSTMPSSEAQIGDHRVADKATKLKKRHKEQ